MGWRQTGERRARHVRVSHGYLPLPRLPTLTGLDPATANPAQILVPRAYGLTRTPRSGPVRHARARQVTDHRSTPATIPSVHDLPSSSETRLPVPLHMRAVPYPAWCLFTFSPSLPAFTELPPSVARHASSQQLSSPPRCRQHCYCWQIWTINQAGRWMASTGPPGPPWQRHTTH
jgi:hypothetical protein